MSDTCYMQITCLAQDAPRFRELGFHIEAEEGSTVEMMDEEANYGHCGELPEDIPWVGWNGAGGNYGPSEHACDGKTIAEIDSTEGGGIVVRLNDDEEAVDPQALEHIRAYRATKKRAEAMLAAANQVVENPS